ncbi:MAG: anion permease [Archaeoglobaceae archaeon]|nr:anion permease [Archaeoglobaceae archaeon]MDW8117670.1 anion permease [Archaeoglobaceae archaeon]
MIELAPLIAFLAIAFSIGSNDTSNAFGICIGCRVISLKKASFLLFVFVILGLIMQGSRVIKTVGEDLVSPSTQISAIALIISALIVVLTNIRGIPVSTHQVIVGSLTGAGVAFGASVSLKTLTEIVISWLLSPFIAGILAILLLISIEKALRSFPVLKVEKIVRYLMLSSALLIAYNMGANELATAIAPLVATDTEYYSKALLGALSVSAGAIALSKRIVETLCKGITSIDPKSGFSAQFGAGLSVYLFTILGMPVSTTYSLVGGISAIGFFKGFKTVKTRKLGEITLNWISAPLIAFILSFTMAKIFIGF